MVATALASSSRNTESLFRCLFIFARGSYVDWRSIFETFSAGERSPMNVLKMASHKDVS